MKYEKPSLTLDFIEDNFVLLNPKTLEYSVCGIDDAELYAQYSNVSVTEIASYEIDHPRINF